MNKWRRPGEDSDTTGSCFYHNVLAQRTCSRVNFSSLTVAKATIMVLAVRFVCLLTTSVRRVSLLPESHILCDVV